MALQEQQDLVASILLGYEVERGNPNINFDLPPRDEVEWLAAWLIGEGWRRNK
jgi:hypothetical protein